MNTYYWELEKERRLTNSLEELVLHWRGSSQLFLFLNQRQSEVRGQMKKGRDHADVEMTQLNRSMHAHVPACRGYSVIG